MTMDAAANHSTTGKRDLVVAFIVGHPKAGLLLRHARKTAQEIGGRWCVLYVETSDEHKQPLRYEQILNLLTRAKHMGAEVDHIHALSVMKGAEEFLERESAHLYSVVVGGTDAEHSLINRLRTPVWVRMVQLSSRYAKVETVPLTGQFIEPFVQRMLSRVSSIEPRHVFYGIASMAVPLLLAQLLKWSLPPILFRINEQNIDNLFLITAGIVAGRFGLAPGLVSAIAGFFINNYYFTLPYHQIKLNGPTDWFGMGMFLSAAVFISLFTSQMREYTQRLKKRELYSEMLFTLYRLASESFSREQAMETLRQNLNAMLDVEVVFFLPSAVQANGLEAVSPVGLALEENDRKALQACWSEMRCTGASSPYNPGTQWRFEPMICASGEVGVLGAKVKKSKQLDAWFGRLLAAAADQTATILAHLELENSMEATRLSQEREKLRVMLLSSVSHDLKTPLAGIIGSLSACQTLAGRLKPEQQQELLAGSLEEAQRLDSFITNILDMTKLETGNVKFRMGWHHVNAMTEQVIERLAHRLKQRKVSMHFPDGEVDAYMDDIMTSQVLQNLIDNACKYTHSSTPIEITWDTDGKYIVCHIRDHGPGIPDDKLQSVFDKYTRLQKQDMKEAGTGLGLAISKAILEAQGGWIKAGNHPDGGAIFSFCLPEWRPHQAIVVEKEKYHAALK